MSLSTSASSAVLNSCEYASFLGATRLRLAENGDEASSLPYPPRLRRQSEGIRVANEGADRSGGSAVAAGARVTVGTEQVGDERSASCTCERPDRLGFPFERDELVAHTDDGDREAHR